MDTIDIKIVHDFILKNNPDVLVTTSWREILKSLQTALQQPVI